MNKPAIYSNLEDKINRLVSDRHRSLRVILILAALAYINIFPNDYVMDDFDYIVNWPLIQNLANLPRFFVGFISPEGQGGIYSPLKTLFHSLIYIFSFGHPIGFHVIAMVVQLLGVYIVYRLTITLIGNQFISFLTALLFALHPVHVEAITPMTAVTDTLGSVFLFFAFYHYIKAVGYDGALIVRESGPQTTSAFYQASPAASSGKWNIISAPDYGRALLFAALAIYTHELAIVLPVFFICYDYFFSGTKNSLRLSIVRTAPYFCIAGSYALLKWLVLGSITRGHYLYESFYLTMMVMIKAWAKYLAILLFPFNLTHDHIISPGISAYDQTDFDQYAVLSQSPLEPQIALSLVILVALLTVAIMVWRKRPLITFCIGWLFISLLPGSNLIPSSVYFAERYLYPGSWAFCLLVAYGIYRVYTNQKIGMMFVQRSVAIVCVIGLLAFYLGRTCWRNFDWRSQLSIYEAAVRANPQSAVLRNDMGIVYSRFGELVKAKESFEKSIAMKPNESHFYFSAEETYSSLEEYDQAIILLKKAVDLNPQFAEAYFNLAGIHAYLEKTQEARQYLAKAVDLYREQGRMLEAGQALSSLEGYLRLPREPRADEAEAPAPANLSAPEPAR